jgi:YHS domain-containing protein
MAMVKDPICGKDVDTLRARAVGIYGGVTYYFCSQDCKSKYVDPRKAARPEPAPAPKAPAAPKLVAAPIEKKKDPTPIKTDLVKKDPTPVKKELAAREDPSLDGLPALKHEVVDNEPFEDLPVEKPPKVVHSPSVIAEVRDMKKGSRRWAMIIVLLAAAVVAAAVLSLRN